MIYLIIKSYFTIFLSIGTGIIFLFLAGLYFICKFFYSSSHSKSNTSNVLPDDHQKECQLVKIPDHPHDDLCAISGDDFIATQLDLARAYIETNKKHLAKNILEQIIQQESAIYQKEAQRLLSII